MQAKVAIIFIIVFALVLTVAPIEKEIEEGQYAMMIDKIAVNILQPDYVFYNVTVHKNSTFDVYLDVLKSFHPMVFIRFNVFRNGKEANFVVENVDFCHMMNPPTPVTITNLSDKYERSMKEISSALSKWLKAQDNKKFHKEYILKGTHKEGYPLITVVHEDKLEKAKAAVRNPYYFLYSVELSSSSLSLDLPKLSQVKVKNLRLPADILQSAIKDVEKPAEVAENSAAVPIRQEIKPTKKPENFFKQKPIEPVDSKTSKDSKVEVVPDNKIKTESSPTDTKVTDKNSKPNSSKNNRGLNAAFFNGKPSTAVKTEAKIAGKNKGRSITTFFHAKQKGAVKSESNAHVTNGKDRVSTYPKIQTNPLKVDEATSESESNENKFKCSEKLIDSAIDEKQAKKRSLDDSETKQRKSAKKFKAASTGRKRIIVDSSDEENIDTDDTPDNALEVPVVQKVEMKVPVVQKVEPKEENEIEEIVATKPLEPLTYQDDDGFLITVKDNKKPNNVSKKVRAPSPMKKNLEKLDKVPVKAAKKQGSITNFFMKK